jgi:ubiquinone/menaquinone biosynthesis C-methylase UbiE
LETSKKSIPVFDSIWSRDKYLAEINPAQIHRRRLTKYFLKKSGIKPQSILDIGCGTGELIKLLFHIYPNAQFYGCDISKESGRLTMAVLPSARFYCLNAEEAQKDVFDKHMDLITCCEVLEHCSHPAQVLKNAYQWLNNEGLFFCSVPAGSMTAYDRLIGHQHHYTSQEIRELLCSEGFCDVHVQYWGYPFHTLYRELVRAASSRMENKEKADPNQYFLSYWLCCKIFNLLFYLNFLKSGCQIFGWGYKRG